jgi:hypothetical protein
MKPDAGVIVFYSSEHGGGFRSVTIEELAAMFGAPKLEEVRERLKAFTEASNGPTDDLDDEDEDGLDVPGSCLGTVLRDAISDALALYPDGDSAVRIRFLALALGELEEFRSLRGEGPQTSPNSPK